MELLIVRHGETEWSLSGRHSGVTDLPLTAKGVQEAERLGPIILRFLGGREPVVFTSPRRRALETARLCMPKNVVTTEHLLSEYDYGEYEGLTIAQIHETAPRWEIWSDGCPKGETTAAVGARADCFLNAFVMKTDGPVVAVTHGHYSRILAARALGKPAEDGSMFASSTASISIVKNMGHRYGLYLWNMTTDGRVDGSATAGGSHA